jgi:hypothetical protein
MFLLKLYFSYPLFKKINQKQKIINDFEKVPPNMFIRYVNPKQNRRLLKKPAVFSNLNSGGENESTFF